MKNDKDNNNSAFNKLIYIFKNLPPSAKVFFIKTAGLSFFLLLLIMLILGVLLRPASTSNNYDRNNMLTDADYFYDTDDNPYQSAHEKAYFEKLEKIKTEIHDLHNKAPDAPDPNLPKDQYEAKLKECEENPDLWCEPLDINIDTTLITATLFRTKFMPDYAQDCIDSSCEAEESEEDDAAFYRNARSKINKLAEYQVVEYNTKNAFVDTSKNGQYFQKLVEPNFWGDSFLKKYFKKEYQRKDKTEEEITEDLINGIYDIYRYFKDKEDENLDIYGEYGAYDGCGEIALHGTTLSKDEFVNGLKAYMCGKGGYGQQMFCSNAELIYNIGKATNVNPELIVARAVREGFSPGNDIPSKNNFWGIGCYNGVAASACTGYSSFEAGVRGFVSTVSGYANAASMMSKYGYIGKFWYNPGNWGLGGCVYASYIAKYLSPSRAQEVSRICSGAPCYSGGGAGCVRTTSEDQTAYSRFGLEGMNATRKEIWGEFPECGAGSSAQFYANFAGYAWPTLIGGTDGYREFQYSTFDNSFHKGKDIGVACGTPVVAICDGYVISASTGQTSALCDYNYNTSRSGINGGMGNFIKYRCIKTKDTDPITVIYMHLKYVYSDIKAGTRISKCQSIGEVGSTGSSTGPHLHFQSEMNNTPVDPRRFITKSHLCSERGKWDSETVKKDMFSDFNYVYD